MDFKDELLQTYIEESTDIIERIRKKLENFQESSNKQERFQDILRAIHTIKGNSGTLNFFEIKSITHELESNLLVYKTKEEEIPKKILDNIFKYTDYLENEIINNNLEKNNAIVSTSNETFHIFSQEEVPHLNIQENLNTEKSNDFSKEKIAKEKFENKSTNSSNEIIRVTAEKVQQNFDIISEIFLIRNQMKYLVDLHYLKKIENDSFFQNWDFLDNSLRKCIGELEQIALSMRMMPIKSLLRRMEKAVRSYLDEHNDKDIVVQIDGEDIEIDKKILDSLAEPLIHLTRNAMDHGIETILERKSLEKPPKAIIRLSVQIIANEAIIKVSDDGRGIDEQKVLNSAIKKGMDVKNITSKEEILNLIFLPGFSTAEKISDISGRGIGLEAVKSYVESLGGNLSIKTEINKGTDFILRLPLGMSVVPVIIAKANGYQFAILNNDVFELKNVLPNEIVKNGNETYYKRGNDFIKCFNIEDYLYKHLKKDKEIFNYKEKIPLCIISYAGKIAAVQVGEFISNAEIVVKEYPSISPELPYISGVSILATGESTFVISLTKLCDRITKKSFGKNLGQWCQHE
ncbi:chemotaxis protein CheA [Fluviispira sanaruensis]|uniref:histidine kinase n=1 Tax=Fluviispira sanaruensis TaxID=2493639 RepID=A0A4P2VHG4_FLUSA|nr:ATP-binding protein [Fluviispira sanaruensis]BBH52346.1 hybrid sensor histidine kinase/response regulator [Fluviispira sanaruensis]